jgi:hypothetical protein
MQTSDHIRHAAGRVVLKCDLESKNFHTFSHGLTIRRERNYDNFNLREVNPVNATVISSEEMPAGAEVLIHHNSLHETYLLRNFQSLSGEETASTVKYYGIPAEECFLWRTDDADEWTPCKGFTTGLRVYEPYRGLLEGIAHKKLKDTLYITHGDLKGKVVRTLHACDYEIIYQGRSGREERIIRLRHFEGEENPREEIICVLDELTEKVNRGELYVGLSASDCAPLNNQTHA